eukprot:UN33881
MSGEDSEGCFRTEDTQSEGVIFSPKFKSLLSPEHFTRFPKECGAGHINNRILINTFEKENNVDSEECLGETSFTSDIEFLIQYEKDRIIGNTTTQKGQKGEHSPNFNSNRSKSETCITNQTFISNFRSAWFHR